MSHDGYVSTDEVVEYVLGNGLIDLEVALDLIEEYMDDPESFEVIRKAFEKFNWDAKKIEVAWRKVLVDKTI